MQAGVLRSCVRCGVVWLCLAMIGCSAGEGRNLPLDPDQAMEACKEFLTTWQSGESATSLEPEIVGRDIAWENGLKLSKFEILANETDGGSNLHIPVRLTLKDAKGTESTEEVTYIVGTSPRVTVFRD